MEWQTLAAAGVVTITLVIFLARPKKKTGCKSGCGCGKPEA